MATISIADSDARVQYTQAVTANSTTLTIDFPFFSLDDINVIVTSAAGVDTTLTRGTGTGTFAVNGTSVDDGFSGGNITLGDTYSNAATKFTIFRDIPVTRTTDFPTSGPFNVSALNTELDKIFAIEQELETKLNRTMKLADSDTAATLSLPNLDTRKGSVLAFNTVTGLPEAGPTIGDVSTVAAITSDIGLLADIQDGTTATNAITTVSGISSAVTGVNSISSAVSGVNSISSAVTSVNSNATNINKVAAIDSNVTTVAGIDSDVTTVAGIQSQITSVAADATDIGAVAGKATEIGRLGTADAVADLALLGTSDAVSDMNTLAGISSNITTVAGVSSNVTTVAGISSDVTAVAGDATDIGAVAAKATEIGRLGTTAAVADLAILGTSDAVSDMNTLAAISSNITTVAGISSNVTTVADISSDVTAAAGKATEIGRLGTTAAVADLAILGTTDAVADMNTLAAISSDITSLAGALEKTYTVTVTNPGSGNVFVLDGNNNPTISMFRGNTYIFDQSDSSNSGHPIAFKDSGGSAYTTGVTSTGTPGSSGAKTTIEVASDAPSSLRYYCTAHGNSMGNTITVTDSNISLVATNIANVNLTGGSITNVNSVAGSISNVNTVATNISSVNDFADKYRIGATDPTANNDEGDLFYNTTTNTLKVYTGSAFEAGVTAGSGFAALAGATFTGDVNHNDSVKAQFGAGNDLQIYHDGGASRIVDAGTGPLALQGHVVKVLNAAGDETMAVFTQNDSVKFYYDNSKKVETTSTGIDVTGTAQADSFTLDNGSNDWTFTVSSNNLIFSYAGTAKMKLDSSGNLTVTGDVISEGTI